MEDKLQLFYNSLTANPNIKGLPDDFDVFRTTLADPAKSELFFNSLKANPNIKGLPDNYNDFVNGLALNSGGIGQEPESPEPQQEQRPGFLEGLNKKFASSIYGAGEAITEIPQFGESVKQFGVKTLADAYINRLVKKGKITAQQAEIEKQRTDTYLPKFDFLGAPHKATTEKLPGAKLADSDLNKWLSETSDRLSKEGGARYEKRVVDYLKTGQFGKAVGAEIYGITESLAPTLLAALGGPVGAGALGVMTGAETYDEVKDREDMQEAAKVIDGLSTGMFEALFEYLGTAEMTRWLKNKYSSHTKNQVEEALKGTLGGLLSKAYKRFGVWFAPVHEGLSEGLTTLGQNATAKFTGEDPERKLNDNFIESVLIGMGMGGVFAGTEKGLETLAKKFKGTPVDQGPAAIGELKVPYTQEQAAEIINNIGRDLKFGDTPLEEDPSPMISFAQTMIGQKVILKKEGGIKGDDFFIAFDLETNEPVLVKAKDIKERKDVPYQEWFNNELQNYNIVKSQADNMAAQMEAPVQPGQEITLKDKNFYVSEVTPEGIVLNEIDEEGNISGAAITITPDQYNTVFGLDQGIQEEGNLPQNEPVTAIDEGIQAAPEAPGARTLTVGKTNYSVVPDETGILTIDQVFTDEAVAKNAVKALEKGYPKASFSLQKTEFEDFLTPDEYRITVQPKKAKAEPAKPEGKAEKPAEPEKVEPVKVVGKNEKGEEIRVGDEIGYQWRDGFITKPGKVIGVEHDPGSNVTWVKTDGPEGENKLNISVAQVVKPEEPAEVIDEKKEEAPSTPDETAPVEAEMQKAGEVEQVNSEKEPTESELKEIVKKWDDEWDKQYKRLGRLKNVSIDKITENTNNQLGISLDYYSKYIVPNLKKPTDDSPEVQLIKANDQVDTRPTEAQKKAGNYKKGHLSLQGFDISIENPAGSVRSGTDKSGKKWSVKLNNSYGYFRRTKGKDGDQIDVFLGDNLDSESVYVIDQVDPQTGLFDEHKVMFGFNSAQDARDNYLANYEPSWKGIGAISKMSVDQFKEWLGDGTRTRKPVDNNVPVKKAEKPSKLIKEVTLRPKRKFTWGPNSRTGKVMARTPNSFREAALQFFVGGGRIKTQDFLDHTGYKRGSREFKQYIWAFKNDGVRLDVFHEALENSFGIEDKGYMDMINKVIDILRTYPGRGQMITALEELQNVDKVPDHMLPPEEDPALEYDDLQGADEEVNKIVDDIMELPEVKEIVKQYSSDGILDVDKLLAGIEANPGEFTIFPFALKKSELLKLKERLQDEQRRRTQESQARTDQYNQDQGQGTGENTPRSAQGNTVRAGREETTEPAGRPEVTLENPQKPKSEFVGEILEQGVSKPTSKEYRYKMLARPFDIGTFPKPGFIKSENDPEGGYQILTYDRKLTPEEQRKWEFLPLTEIAEIKGKEFVDKDGYFSRIVLNWFGGDKYAKVSMYDTDGNLADEIPGMKASEILQNVNEGYWTEKTKEGGTKDDQKDKTGLPGEKREGKEPEQAKPVEETGTKETPASGVFQAQKEQVNILKDLVSAEVTAEATQKRIDELGRIQNPTKNQLQELKYQKLALDPLQTRIEKLKSQVDNTIVPEVKVTEIKQLILETEAANAIIGDRIIGLQNKRNAKEKELQKRNEAFGDRKLEEEKKAGMQTMFAGDIFAPDAGNLKAALKPFNDAIQKSKEELLRNDQLLDEQIDLVLKGTQQKIKYGGPKELEPKESPVASRPTTPIEDQMPLEQDDKPTAIEPENKESLPKLEDFGEKIGGARKDLGITRKVRDTDSLPAWRRKYSYANADGTMIIGQAVDTSKPFIVQWAKEIDSWVGKRTRYSPVTTIDTRETKIFNSEDEAEAYIPIYEVWKQNFRVHKSGDNYVITKKSSTGKAVEYATFPTEEDANVYMYSTEGATSLLNHKREDFSIPALDKVERSGKDWRKGKDISPEEFMNAFGFRGGEFGNWVKPEERRVMLNAAYDSFMDLAALLNIPPKALSFGGELSIAFGARGTKGAAAHFEPDRAVINLTRMNGAGSLAHEWAHALDNYFGLQGAKKDYSRNEKGEVKAGRVMRTEAGLLSIQGMRQQLSTIFDAIVDATQQKSVTRVMGIDEKQKSFDKIKKNVQQDADSLIKKFENGVRRYQYNRKTKQREEVTVKATPKQIKKAKEIVNIIIDGKGTKPVWQRIPGSKGMGKYSYISPETLALEELHKAVFGRTGLDRDGNGFYNLGYFSDKMYRAKEILDKALAGESETLNVPTDFLKTSKTFDASRAMPYWSTKVEMFARAFEYFVETKLLDQNIRADYLQYDKAPVYEAIYGKNPYPSGEERSNLNNLFGKFFETIQTKEEGGKVAMFRISEDLYFSPVEKALDAIKQDKATPEQWKAMLLKNGAKEAELSWMGWDELVDIPGGAKTYTKEELRDWISQNKVEIKEVGYGGEAKDNRYYELLRDVERAQRPIQLFEAVFGDYPYYNITSDKWVYKDEKGEIKDVPENDMPDVLKWNEAKLALDAYIDDNTNIYGDFEVAGATKYNQYTLPGGEDYRELLLTMPDKTVESIDIPVWKKNSQGLWAYFVRDRQVSGAFAYDTEEYREAAAGTISKNTVEGIKGNFQSAHWGDVPNILAHVRFNTRRTPDGKNILFIEEIQSDWAQEGKKKGFKSDIAKTLIDPKKGEVVKTDWGFKLMLNGAQLSDITNYEIEGSDNITSDDDIRNELIRKASGYNKLTIQGGISDMPFKKTDQWAGLALRRMIRYAIDNGFDAIAWTPGEVQNERYDLSKQVESITAQYTTGRVSWVWRLHVTDKSGNVHTLFANDQKELEDTVGKELGDKIFNDVHYKHAEKTYSGLDLKIGGSGMKGFYDNILPSIANKLGKKFGSQVEKVVVSERIDRGLFFDGTDITDADGNVVKANTSEDEYKKLVNADKDNSISVHSLPITEAMFDSYRQGIPLFKKSQRLTGESLLFDVVSGSTRENWENEVRDKVRILADSLNTKIEVINNRTQLPERIQRQALRQGITSRKHMAGVYDPQTDTVYVLLDDIRATGTIRGIEEVTKTVLHEVVAHQGLPALLGEEEYNKFLDDLFWNIPQIDRSFLMEQYNTSNPRTIAEEYLGMMAEQNINPTLFQKVLAKIRQLLRKLFKVNYTENDVHDMLRRSRENLQKPKASDYTSAQEYLEATDSYEKARFRIAQAYKQSIVDQAAEVYKEKEAKRSIEETKQGIREYIQDLNLPIRKFEEEVLKRGGKQDNESKPYRDTSLSFGRQEKLYNDFFDQKMKPVLAAVANIKKSGVSGEEVLPYIICKHAIERNRAFREKELNDFIESHPDAGPDKINDFQEKIKDKDYSGVMAFDTEGKYTSPDELAKDIASEFESQVDKKLINDLWSNLREANSTILDTWEVGGQISTEQKQEYLAKFKYFVPLRGWRDGAAKELRYTKGQGFSHSLRHAEGRKSLADNPLAYILNVEFQAIAEQVTNEVNSSMLNLIIRNLNNNEIHELATLKKLYYLKVNLPDGSHEWEPTLTRPTPEQFANGEATTKIYREHERLRAPSQAQEHEVIVHKPGGDMVMIFKGKNLSVAQALNKQNYLYRTIFGNTHDARDINRAMALLGDINNMLKAAYTSWNVVFPFTNFMRDFQEASLTQAIKQGSGLKVIRNYKHTFPAIIRQMTGRQNLNNPIDRSLDEFYKAGGATGYTHLKTPEEIEKDINKEIKRMVRAGTLRGDMANTAHKFLLGIENWNRIFEDATRFSVYLASLAAGNTKEDAASDAKEASVNFNRKGKGSKAWDAWFAFFNVALQSMQKNFSLAKNYTGKFSAVALSFVTLGFLEAMMNALFDDDEDTSYYNINPYMRQNYLLIPNIPALIKGESKGDKYLSIPLPQFWRGFKSMGAIGFDIATKRMNVKDGIMHALGNFGSSLLPVDIGGFWKSGELSLAPIMPTVIKPITEVLENRNYMGYAIKNEPFTKDQEKVLARAGLGKKNVSPAAKFITDMLFRWGGGDSKYKYYYDSYQGRSRKVPGILDINPSTIEHLFKGYTGGTGAVFSDMITTISQGLSAEQEIDYRNAPFVNKFIRKIPEAKWNVISEYYDLRDDSKITSDLSTNYFKEGQYEKALEIMGDEYLMKYVETFKHYESALDDAKKDTDFDEVEGNYRGIELMRQCISDIKDLKEQFGRK